MEKITDLQLCSCIMLKYALETGQNEAFSELIRIITIDMDMNYDMILNVMRDIKLTENKKSFIFVNELGKFASEKILAASISNN